MNQAPLSAGPWRQNRARAVSPVTGGCFAFVDRLRCCCCSYGLPVTRPARAGAGWAPSSRPPRLLQHRLERSSSMLPSRLLEQGSQRESPHGTQLERPALELTASGNLSVGLVLLCLEHPLLATVHLLVVPVRQALMLILGSLSVSCLLQAKEDEWGSRNWAAAAALTEGEHACPAHMAPPPCLRSCSSSRPGSVPPTPFMCSPPSFCTRSDRERRSSIQPKKILKRFFFNSPRTTG
ncbi:uncharacterized protein LOC125551264 isoform X2 [Triticum urartu]|uniref:uncharacterized protein LOC125551264 isoform X2 n=1 Tax=Triticum urartu TaxID=4572 RepID=UPI002042E4A5|nr:uncharacterized protein LOC125551264 isoform X2 [Triticum urartu]